MLSSRIAQASPGLLNLHAWRLWALVFVRGLAGHGGHGLPGHRSGSQGVYSSHWDMVSQAIVLTLKGFTPHTGTWSPRPSFWLSRGLLLTLGHGLPGHRSGSQGVYSSHGDMVSQAIVLALKGFTPHTGSTGFAGPRTTRCILATALVLKLPIAGVPLQDLSFSVSIPSSIVQPFAPISVNSVALISLGCTNLTRLH